jgi:hypothetical protein
MEAEYVAQNHASQEALWLGNFIKEVIDQDINPIKINSDNQGAIALSKDNKFHARMKHIDVTYHFVHENVQDGKVIFNFVSGTENVADILTKPLPRPQFIQCCTNLGLCILRGSVEFTSTYLVLIM